MAMDPAELRTAVTVIADEFSTMTDAEYANALAEWLAEVATTDPVDVPVSAADTLHEIREHGES